MTQAAACHFHGKTQASLLPASVPGLAGYFPIS
jgi:hypothetical protein